MDEINIFENSKIIYEKKHKIYINIYIICIFILLIIILLNMFLFKYNKYYKYYGQVIIDNDSYYIKMYIEDEYFYLLDNELLFNNNIKNYKITKISDDLIIDNNYKKYYEISIKFNIEKKYLINNNIIYFDFKDNTTTLYKEIKKLIKKGINL